MVARDRTKSIATSESTALQSILATTDIGPRPISRDGQHLQRHATRQDLDVDELDHDYRLDLGGYPFQDIASAQDLFSGAVYQGHLAKDENFGARTSVDCFSMTDDGAEWLRLNDERLDQLLREVSAGEGNEPPPTTTRRALVFFVQLEPASGSTSFNYSVPITKAGVKSMFSSLRLNHEFLQNMLGRPDYWAPRVRWEEREEDEETKDEEEGEGVGRHQDRVRAGDDVLASFDLSCQFPRWNLQAQGAPLSVYCRYDAERDTTLYVVSHKPHDTVVSALRRLLDNAVTPPPPAPQEQQQQRRQGSRRPGIAATLLDSPLDLQVMIANLNFEASKWHLSRFRRFQWRVVNKVDDHLAGLETRDRAKLAELLREMQVLTQNTDSHLANAQVFLFTVRAVEAAAQRLCASSSSSSSSSLEDSHRRPPRRRQQRRARQRTLDMANHALASMEKQHMWFLNYKSRKESVMGLIFHITAQTDALNNIEIASDMKRDSTSMNAIAGLTMVFLPGTFTASVLSAGIFQPGTGGPTSGFKVTGLWWLWVVTTLPATLGTVLCWWWYKSRRERGERMFFSTKPG